MFDKSNRRLVTQVITGLTLIVIGFFFLLDNMDLFYLHDIWKFWPFIIVAFGIGRIITAEGVRDYLKAGWLIFIGLWLYMSLQHVFGITFAESWPLILIAWGISIVLKELFIPKQETNHEEKECCHGN